MNKLVVESVAILGLALLGASCIMAVGAQNAASRPRPSPAAQAVPPTIAAPATVAVAAPLTNTPIIEPTATPVPTQPPLAPAEAKAKPAEKPEGEAIRAYLEWLQPKIQQAGQASTALAGQFDQFSREPAMIANQEWRLKTGVALGFLQNSGKEMQGQSRPVPRAAAEVDRDVRMLGTELVNLSNDYATGLDRLDRQRFQSGNERLQRATQRMNGLTPKIQALREQQGG